MQENDWYKDWFNTPYYHTLYKDRDYSDAQLFIKNITSHLKIPKNGNILDLPCGKGRHSIYLNSLGYKVTGGDISENSINFAKQYENEKLDFIIHDMRLPLKNKYDGVFNIFTSFGYFDDDNEDLLILKNIKNALRPNGVFVFDFLNVIKLKENLVESEIKIVDNISFNIKREISKGFIIKTISFIDGGKNYIYKEKVKFLDKKKIEYYFEKNAFKISDYFGDYHLNQFNEQNSDRLIIVAK